MNIEPTCFSVVQGFFLATTIVFFVLCILLARKSKKLRAKISSLIEVVGLKDKEIDDLKNNKVSLLQPLAADNKRSIIISIDTAGKVTGLNDYAEEVFGYKATDVVGKPAFGTLFPIPEKANSLQANLISRIFSNPSLYMEYETQNMKKSGEPFWISWTNRVVYDDNGNPVEIKAVGFDITRRKKLEQELHYLTSIDPLTGALNRQTFLESATTEIKRANRYKRQLSVMVMGLDYFHSVGDNNTHSFSDDILQETVAVCRKAMRGSDLLGRIGDVEFAMVLPETPAENAVFLAERLKSKIQEKNLKSKDGSFVTASFGVANRDSKDDTIDSLLLRAMNALKQAKAKQKKRS